MDTSRELSSVDQLRRLSPTALDDLFRAAVPGEAPVGRADGTAILLGGGPARRVLEVVIRAVAWRGKVFDADGRTLRNLVGPMDVPAVAADVYVGESRLDARPAIVIDYRGRSRIAGWVRDEIRPVGDGLYLGIVFGAGRRLPGVRFALQLRR